MDKSAFLELHVLLIEDSPGDADLVREPLAEIKRDPDLKRIPVVVLTTSEAEQDILDAYEYSANAYIVKPVDFEPFFKTVKSLEDFWLTVVRYPPR